MQNALLITGLIEHDSLYLAVVNRQTELDSTVSETAWCCEPHTSGRVHEIHRTKFAHARRRRACA